MSTLSLTLRQAPHLAVDLSPLLPSKLANLSTSAIERIELGSGHTAVRVGDLFTVSGTPGEVLTISGNSGELDHIGSGLESGTIVVEGNIGNYAGTRMKGGRLDIRGNAGSYVASVMKGGVITVSGSVGDYVGGVRPGDRFGMLGGTVVIEGSTGTRAGERMRRGTIVVRGKFGPAAGSRMAGGTLWTETGFGPGPGALLRRGTLIGPAVDELLPTFADCGYNDLGILRIISRYVSKTLGPLAPKPLPPKVRRLAGDLATIGKGEILLTV
jgi:formylmethanofuran dehydrogenase subunit C